MEAHAGACIRGKEEMTAALDDPCVRQAGHLGAALLHAVLRQALQPGGIRVQLLAPVQLLHELRLPLLLPLQPHLGTAAEFSLSNTPCTLHAPCKQRYRHWRGAQRLTGIITNSYRPSWGILQRQMQHYANPNMAPRMSGSAQQRGHHGQLWGKPHC